MLRNWIEHGTYLYIVGDIGHEAVEDDWEGESGFYPNNIIVFSLRLYILCSSLLAFASQDAVAPDVPYLSVCVCALVYCLVVVSFCRACACVCV